MIREYELLLRKDALVVTKNEGIPIFVRDLEKKTFSEIWAEFKEYLANRGEKFSHAYLSNLTDTYISFWIIAFQQRNAFFYSNF